MFRGRRRTRRRAQWDWALTGSFTITDPGLTQQNWATSPILPVGRVKWLCDTRKRDHITVAGILGWLDVLTYMSPTAGGGVQTGTIPPWDLYIIKSQADETESLAAQYLPFQAPDPPASVTSYFTTAETADGLDPFMWVHHLSPYVAGTAVPILTQAGNDYEAALNAQANVESVSDANIDEAVIQYTNSVQMQFQPNLVIKTKRKLTRTDELVFGIAWEGQAGDGPPGTNGAVIDLAFRFRMLFQ